MSRPAPAVGQFVAVPSTSVSGESGNRAAPEDQSAAERLREDGIDVVHASDVGLAGADDLSLLLSAAIPRSDLSAHVKAVRCWCRGVGETNPVESSIGGTEGGDW